jgi:hypothetical protein
MESVEYLVLTRGELGGWSGSDAGSLGRDLASILNAYARRGWRVVVGRESQLILERPRQPDEPVPVDPPTGRGDEASATE